MILQTDERKRPEISVIVPAYNVAPYLAACLDSILAQTFRDFELIIVDDGSTDGSGEIAEAYAERDERVRLVKRRWNRGGAAARNLGMEVGEGAYVVFIDADDLVPPDHLATLYRAAEEENADLAAAGFHMFAQTPGDGRDFIWTEEPFFLPQVLEERVACFAPTARIQIAPWGKIYRKSFLDHHHLEFPDVPVANDVCFHYQCLLAAERYLVLPGKCYWYRGVREGSLQSVRGLRRAEQYAVSLTRSLEAFRAWARQEQLGDDGMQKKLCHILYLFYGGNLQMIVEACGMEAVIQHCQTALCGEPHRVLDEMRMYHAFAPES